MTRATLLVALVWCGCQTSRPDVSPSALVAPVETASRTQVMADVAALADDAFLGREAGTTGGHLAARYVERRFAEIGLEGAFQTGYRQPVALPTGGEGTNLVGRILGSVYPQQAIVVTAHFDHLGVRSGQVYNGADDNASGVAAMLAVAEHYAETTPAHTILFAALDAEEAGLAGAQTMVTSPPVPLGAVLAVVNLDMVSRGELWAAGTTHYPHLRPILQGLDLEFGRDTGTGASNWTGASGHAVFHRRGVPFVYFGVDGHSDYHEPTDDVERIDPAVFGAAVDTILEAVERIDQSHAALVVGR
ncbi:M28 family peptidase [Rubrivirga sp.]|uniref:M28 family peptidase n=1 Tax=Rubrivirga sp. TaxID=1885344 RepID=UPI003C7164C9